MNEAETRAEHIDLKDLFPQQKQAALAALKKSLLQQSFTGEI